jgi:hypothetical protein
MQRLTLEELRERSGEVAAAALRTPGVSALCSGPDWQLAAHDGLHGAAGARSHLIVEDAGSWIIFVERERERIYFPFESAWMFSSPVTGDPDRIVDLLLAAPRWLDGPLGLCLGGIRCESPLHEAVRRIEPATRRYDEFAATECMIIDLGEGVESWLGRRSPKFRRSLREAEKASGIEIVEADGESDEALFARILAVQERTYKWREGTDILKAPEYAAFYRTLLIGLRARGDLRLRFAQRDGEDLAYIFGGVAGDTYRGFQMSYVEEARSLGLGNRLQFENLRRCEAEGVTRYDLGMHSAYKDRWADRREENTGIFLVL